MDPEVTEMLNNLPDRPPECEACGRADGPLILQGQGYDVWYTCPGCLAADQRVDNRMKHLAYTGQISGIWR